MATILVVHGTGDTGAPNGSRWWQVGSEVHKDFARFVESEDGSAADFQQVVWDGANSERSRRAAGISLLSAMHRLEARAAPYCVIGHSHGGTAAAHALIKSIIDEAELTQLARWITVGAPFIEMTRKHSLFARLGLVGRAAYLTAFTFAAVPIAYLSGLALSAQSWGDLLGVLSDVPLTLIQFGLPIALFMAVTWVADRWKYKRYRPEIIKEAGARFDRTWLALNHRNDEAVQGLGSIERLDARIFDRRLLIAPIQFAALLTLPIALAGVMLGGQGSFLGVRVLHNPLFDLGRAILALPYSLGERALAHAPPALAFVVNEVVLVGLAPAILVFLLALIIVAVVYGPSWLISWLSTRSLDPLTWRQIRQSAFGNDTTGETALRAVSVPPWTKSPFAPLHDGIGNRLAATADAAAAQAIGKFRAELAALATGVRSYRDFIESYVTWSELIHTVYFRDPQFRKLLCYAVSQTAGFRAADALRAEPDFAEVKSWYDAIAASR